MIEYPPKRIDCERIYIEKPELATFKIAKDLYEVIDRNRKHVLPWLDWGLPEITKRAEDTFNFLVACDDKWKNKQAFEYIVRLRKGDEIVGGLCAFNKTIGKNVMFEFGYWLDKKHCGYGYMQEAIKPLEKIIASFGVPRIVIRHDVGNPASGKVARALGYQKEGIARKDRWSEAMKEYRDTVILAKIFGDFQK